MKKFFAIAAAAIMITAAVSSVNAYGETNVFERSGDIVMPFIPYDPLQSDTDSEPVSDTDTEVKPTPRLDSDSDIQTKDTPEKPRLKGDIDNDGTITSGDALILLRASVGLVKVESNDIFDIDGDNTVTANDALLVLRRSVGLSADF